jgi:hypothetical protein
MNTIVNAELQKVYDKGINPKITDVKVVFDTKNMVANWEVTIGRSTDGKAWVGLNSRGSSGDVSAYERAYNVQGQRMEDVLNIITTEQSRILRELINANWDADNTNNSYLHPKSIII